jgi:DNA-binding transcriptional ArsR family regulator
MAAAKKDTGSTGAALVGREPSIDARLARALNHPLRMRILAVLNERAASPKELAEILGEELSNVSYHTRELFKLDCIEVAKREQVRGAMKTTYRGTTRMMLDDEAWERLSKETRNGISIAAVGEVIERASRAIEADSFDARTDRHVITLKMDVDETGWSEVSEIVLDAHRRLEKVEVDAANRTPQAGKRFRVTVSLLSYESP